MQGREIKFQAWVPDIGQMAQVAEIDLVHGVVSWYTCEAAVMSGKPDADAFVDRVILRQFTGFHDKNGREIYEGYLLKITIFSFNTGKEIAQKILPVEFRRGKFGVQWADGEFTGLDGFSPQYTTFEVVGNVFEHPHLVGVTAG